MSQIHDSDGFDPHDAFATPGSVPDLDAVLGGDIPEVPADLWSRVLEVAVDPATEAMPGLVPVDGPADDISAAWAPVPAYTDDAAALSHEPVADAPANHDDLLTDDAHHGRDLRDAHADDAPSHDHGWDALHHDGPDGDVW